MSGPVGPLRPGEGERILRRDPPPPKAPPCHWGLFFNADMPFGEAVGLINTMMLGTHDVLEAPTFDSPFCVVRARGPKPRYIATIACSPSGDGTSFLVFAVSTSSAAAEEGRNQIRESLSQTWTLDRGGSVETEDEPDG